MPRLGGVLPGFGSRTCDKEIPIVIHTLDDPVATGAIDSLAQPGANLTGLTTLQGELSGKRLEILKDTMPRTLQCRGAGNEIQPGSTSGRRQGFPMVRAPAHALKLQLQSLAVRRPTLISRAPSIPATKGRASALMTVRGTLLAGYTKRSAELAYKVPTAFDEEVTT